MIDQYVQYFSKTHNLILAVVLAIEAFRYYLYGKQFIVRCDHKPLVSLFKQNKLSSRLLRWKLALSEADFVIQYIPGKTNVVADFLSRIKINNENPQHESLHEFYDSQLKTVEELVRETNDSIIL